MYEQERRTLKDCEKAFVVTESLKGVLPQVMKRTIINRVDIIRLRKIFIVETISQFYN
jgi:hypothetical protein